MYYSIIIVFDGKITGSPWFKKRKSAEQYMINKLKSMNVNPKTIQKVKLYTFYSSLSNTKSKEIKTKFVKKYKKFMR